MQVLIKKPGILSTIQDLGRTGHRSLGIAVSGAMDTLAAEISNILVGNNRNSSVIEMTYGGIEMITETEILISVCGSGAELFADQEALPFWKPIFLPAGKRIILKNSDHGSRSYLAVAGGWQSSVILGSGSTYLPVKIGGLEGRILQTGDRLEGEKKISETSRKILIQLAGTDTNASKWGAFVPGIIDYSSCNIRVLQEDEYNWFTEESIENFFNEPYMLSRRADRMGLQFNGTLLHLKEQRQLLSTSVSMGTIQVTSGGSPFLLMADAQTTGGYPRIARVAAIDLPLCAQLRPTDIIQFEKTELHDAEMLLLEREEKLKELEQAVKQKV